jgi:hypothetical protein
MTAAPGPAPRPAAGWARRIGLGVALLTLLVLVARAWREAFPPFPPTLTVRVEFPAGVPGTAEPLVATGVRGSGDLLAVRYLDAATGVLVYDAWGVGGPVSAPFALESGKPRELQLELPTFAIVTGPKPRDRRPLRAVLDGRPLLDAPVAYHRRAPADLAFGTNPIGGTVATAAFRGRLTLPDGRELRGGPAGYFSALERLPYLIRGRATAVLRDLALSLAAGVLAFGLARIRVRPAPLLVFPLHAQPPHRAFVVTAAVCTLAFTTVITGGTFRLIFPEAFGDFYDHQAASLLRGQLDVPPAALVGEAFVFEGKTYGYFGPTPAVLRLPFVVAGVGFGQLSRAFMVAYFAAALTGLYLLLLHAQRLATGPGSWPSRFNTVVLTATAGLGTTLFFVASRAYIYHEAILCGIAAALWASLFALRWLESPARRSAWLAALACGLASVHARPPVGLFALSMLGCVALTLTVRAWLHSPGSSSPGRLASALRPFGVAVLAGLGVLSFNGLSYLKFRSFDGAPLRYHVQYHPERLANIGGRNFHLSNLPFNASSYFWRPDFELRRSFPYFFIHGAGPDIYPEARIDLAEPVAAIPYTMPALAFLAVVGGAVALRRWPAARSPLGVTAGALTPMTLALLAAVAVSQRYTGDFCPGLLVFAAFGLVGFEALAPRPRLAARCAVVMLLVLSVLITFALTLHYQGAGVWGVPDDIKHRYEFLRASFDRFFGPAAPAR